MNVYYIGDFGDLGNVDWFDADTGEQVDVTGVRYPSISATGQVCVELQLTAQRIAIVKVVPRPGPKHFEPVGRNPSSASDVGERVTVNDGVPVGGILLSFNRATLECEVAVDSTVGSHIEIAIDARNVWIGKPPEVHHTIVDSQPSEAPAAKPTEHDAMMDFFSARHDA